MQQKMAAMPATGNPDINFVVMMVAHHRGPIDMAQEEIETRRDPATIKAEAPVEPGFVLRHFNRDGLLTTL